MKRHDKIIPLLKEKLQEKRNNFTKCFPSKTEKAVFYLFNKLEINVFKYYVRVIKFSFL